MKDRLCPGTTPDSWSIQVRRGKRRPLNASHKSAFAPRPGLRRLASLPQVALSVKRADKDARAMAFEMSPAKFVILSDQGERRISFESTIQPIQRDSSSLRSYSETSKGVKQVGV